MCADKITSLAGGGLTGSGLGSLTGALQGGVNNLINLSSNWLDKFFPPEKREEWKAWLTKFATEKPYLASFLLSQIALSGLPLALFAFMSVTVFIFALLAGILVGVLGALLFVVAAVGFALLILLPILFFTTGAAVFIWLWGVGAYYIVKWFNQKDVPGIHSDAAGGLAKATGLSDLPGLNGTPLGNANASGESGDDSGHSQQQHSKGQQHHHQRAPAKLEKKEKAASTGAQQHHTDAKENNNVHQRKQANHSSSNGPASKVNDTVEGVGKTANGTVGDARKVVGI